MRLRSFTGRSVSEAMAAVRRSLGAEAIIVATEEDPEGGTRITAALDILDAPVARQRPEADVIDVIGDALGRHGLAPELLEKILAAALPFDAEEPLPALASALAALYGFAPLPTDVRGRMLLLAGPPGAGKTVTAAKLAARAVLAGHAVRLVTADTARAGGVEQLEVLARILKAPLHAVAGARELEPVLAGADSGELLLIDTPGINPYSAADRRDLAALISGSRAEALLVLGGGGDAVETVEIAGLFHELGCRRLIATRLDMARRLGGLLGAADAFRFGFAEAGIAPSIADGLAPFNPVLLARLLLAPSAPQRRASERGDA